MFSLNTLPDIEMKEDIIREGQTVRERNGLMMIDSHIVSTMEYLNISTLASNDSKFDRVPTIRRYYPSDI